MVAGVLGAAGNVAFRLAIEGSRWFFHGLSAPLGRFGIPVALVAGGVVLLLLERLFPGEVLGYGFPRFLEQFHLHGARIKRRWIVLKTVGSAISLGAGASVGREGPIAQIGGAIGGLVARLSRLNVDDRKVLVACGTAAGVAATFNAPLAAIMFAQEIVLLGESRLAHLSLVVVAAGTAVATSRQLFGFEAVLHVVPFQLDSYWQCLSYAGLGVVLGLLAVFYTRTFHQTARRVRQLPTSRWSVLLGGLLLVGLIDVVVPQNLSDGYPVIDAALAGSIVWHTALLLALAKIVGSIVSLSCGAPGGVFGPILYIGAMTGTVWRELSALVVPGLTGPRGSYALVGFGAFLAATTHAPLTALFLLLEMTESYTVTVPALITVGLAMLVAQKLEPESIDTYGLHADGKTLHRETLHQLLDRLAIGDAYRTDVEPLSESCPLPEILRRVSEGQGTTLPVVDATGDLVGVLPFNALRSVLLDDDLGGLVVAADLCDRHVPTVTPASTLGDAFRRIETAGVDELPVVDAERPRHVVGMLSRADLIAAYNRAMGSLGALPLDSWLASNEATWHGYRVLTLAVPPVWLGRSLRDVDPRGRFGVTVLAMRIDGSSRYGVPDPDRPFAARDVLVLAGTSAGLRAARGDT
ncbi:MAG TPA: chloride channel protein [Candidatus Binatia bacterium]|nr:chloride channel protein [Candidatus Binatia bacterium]